MDSVKNIDDYYDAYDDLFREILSLAINRSNEPIRLRKINPNMYQKALDDFMKFGEITHYPTKYIQTWKNIIINNFMYLDVITMLWGHTSYFDVDAFNDMFFYNHETGDTDEGISDWSEAMEYLENNSYYDVLDNILPKFSNGQDLISDFGLEPLRKIVTELIETTDYNKIIVLINKALDVSHQRSDLSELFIQGGEASLNRISGVDENIMKIIKEEIYKLLI
ncbi:MAG: hypothetical protein ACOC2W_02210 [bacterium]